MLLPGITTSRGSARHTITGGGGALLMVMPTLTDAPAVAGALSAKTSASREHQGRTRLIGVSFPRDRPCSDTLRPWTAGPGAAGRRHGPDRSRTPCYRRGRPDRAP